MICASLHQFWASLTEVGAKPIETRSFRTSHRGPLAIHAASVVPAYARDEYNSNEPARLVLREHFGINNAYDMQNKLPLGCIICVVDVVDCLQAPTLPMMLEQIVPAEFQTPNWQAFGDFSGGRWLWLWNNVRRLREPIKIRGKQMLWELPPEVVAQVHRRI